MNKAITLLIFSAFSTALFHTLIPDHWLPFVLIGRSRNWSMRKTFFISGFSAFLHIIFSLLLGLSGIVIGLGTAMAAGEAMEKIGGILFLLFGIFYIYWSYRKGGHFHIGGERIHQHERRVKDDSPSCHEKSDRHWQRDQDLIRRGLNKGDLYLAFIIGLNPCILIFPILFYSISHGPLVTFLVALVYFLSTFSMMVGLTLFGLKGARNIRMRFLSKYGEILSGLLIALLGVIFFVFEL